MSNSLIKLIDNSLLPAILIVVGKLLGIYIFSGLFNTQIGLQQNLNSLVSFRPVVIAGDLLQISTYSDVLMFTLVCVGFSIVIINTVYLHESHVSVSTITKLIELNLLSLVKTSYELYHRGVTWFIFIWLTNLIILFNVGAGKTSAWVLLVSFMFSMILSLILFKDVLKEIELSKKRIFQNQY